MAKKTVSDLSHTAQVNSFTGGLNTDLHPMVQPADTLSDCLNGTLITYNGNENMLQNDMGNYALKNAKLPKGYIPVGMKEYGGIVYIASYNPFTKKAQLGSYPSPQTNFSDSLENPVIEINEISINAWEPEDVNGENIFNALETNSNVLYTNYADKVETKFFTNNFDEQTRVELGDQYVLARNDEKQDDPFQSLEIVTIDENKVTESLDVDTTKADLENLTSANFDDNKDIKCVTWEKPGWIGVRNKINNLQSHTQHVSGTTPALVSTRTYKSELDSVVQVIDENKETIGLELSVTPQSPWTNDYKTVFKYKPEHVLWLVPKPNDKLSNVQLVNPLENTIIKEETLGNGSTAVYFPQDKEVFLPLSINIKHVDRPSIWFPNQVRANSGAIINDHHFGPKKISVSNLPKRFFQSLTEIDEDWNFGKKEKEGDKHPGQTTFFDTSNAGINNTIFVEFDGINGTKWKLITDRTWDNNSDIDTNNGIIIANEHKITPKTSAEDLIFKIKCFATEDTLQTEANEINPLSPGESRTVQECITIITEHENWTTNKNALKNWFDNGIDYMYGVNAWYGQSTYSISLHCIDEDAMLNDEDLDSDDRAYLADIYDNFKQVRLIYDASEKLQFGDIIPIVERGPLTEVDLTSLKKSKDDLAMYDVSKLQWSYIINNCSWIITHDNLDFNSLPESWATSISNKNKPYLYNVSNTDNSCPELSKYVTDVTKNLQLATTWSLKYGDKVASNITMKEPSTWYDVDNHYKQHLSHDPIKLDYDEDINVNLSDTIFRLFKLHNGNIIDYKEQKLNIILENLHTEKELSKTKDGAIEGWLRRNELLQNLSSSTDLSNLQVNNTIECQDIDAHSLKLVYKVSEIGSDSPQINYIDATPVITQNNKVIFQNLIKRNVNLNSTDLIIESVPYFVQDITEEVINNETGEKTENVIERKIIIFDNWYQKDSLSLSQNEVKSSDNLIICGFTYDYDENNKFKFTIENNTIVDWDQYTFLISTFDEYCSLKTIWDDKSAHVSDSVTVEDIELNIKSDFYFLTIKQDDNVVYRQAIVGKNDFEKDEVKDQLTGLTNYGHLTLPNGLNLTTSSEDTNNTFEIKLLDKPVEKWCYWEPDSDEPELSDYHILNNDLKPGYYGKACVQTAEIILNDGLILDEDDSVVLTVKIDGLDDVYQKVNLSSEEFKGDNTYTTDLIIGFKGYKYDGVDGNKTNSYIQREYLLKHGYRPNSIWYEGSETFGDTPTIAAYGGWVTADFKYLSAVKASGNNQKVHLDISDMNNMKDGVTQGPVYTASATGAIDKLMASNDGNQRFFPVIGKIGVQNSGFLIPTVSANDCKVNRLVADRGSDFTEEIKNMSIASSATAAGALVGMLAVGLIIAETAKIAATLGSIFVPWGLVAAAAVIVATAIVSFFLWLFGAANKKPVYIETCAIGSGSVDDNTLVLPIWSDASPDTHWPSYIYTHHSDDISSVYRAEQLIVAIGTHLYYYRQNTDKTVHQLNMSKEIDNQNSFKISLITDCVKATYKGVNKDDLQQILNNFIVNDSCSVFDNLNLGSYSTAEKEVPNHWNSADNNDLTDLENYIQLIQYDNFNNNNWDATTVYADTSNLQNNTRFTGGKITSSNAAKLLKNTAEMFELYNIGDDKSKYYLGIKPAYIYNQDEYCFGGSMGYGDIDTKDISLTYYKLCEAYTDNSTLLPIAQCIKPTPIVFDGNTITQGNLLSWFTGTGESKQSGFYDNDLKEIANILAKDCAPTLKVVAGLSATEVITALNNK